MVVFYSLLHKLFGVLDYAALEAALQNEVDNYASLHPGYDEYRFDLDTIEHDPYVLIAILTAYHQGGVDPGPGPGDPPNAL